MDESSKMKKESWKDKGFNEFLSRPISGGPARADYIGGANFDILLDELVFNRMIQLKNLSEKPQGNQTGKIYWDKEDNKFKLWISDSVGWVDVIYTSTSTTSTSSSTSSTSTSTTSTSSSSSSTSSTSSSTSTT